MTILRRCGSAAFRAVRLCLTERLGPSHEAPPPQASGGIASNRNRRLTVRRSLTARKAAKPQITIHENARRDIAF